MTKKTEKEKKKRRKKFPQKQQDKLTRKKKSHRWKMQNDGMHASRSPRKLFTATP